MGCGGVGQVSCLLVTAALLGGCGRAPGTGDSAPDAGSSETDALGPGSDTASADATPDRYASLWDDAGDAGGVGRSCSADLQSVVDDSGHVVQACAPDQGCAHGQCIAACDATAADHGSVGCDFYVSTPAFDSPITSPCFVVFLTNGWTSTATIGVSRGGMSYDPTVFARLPSAGASPSSWPTLPATGLPPNEVAVLFLSSDPASAREGTPLVCPVADAVASGTAVWGVTGTSVDGGPQEGSATGRGTAWHITSSIPLNGYDVLPFGGARSYLPSAQLLLPTSAWGNNYVAALPPAGLVERSWAQIVAAQDSTQVNVVPTVDLPSGAGVDAAPHGISTSFLLNAGEVLQWQWLDHPGDMSGSVVSSDKPVLFVGGHGDLCLRSATSNGGGCDSEHELVPPVSALGREYAAIPYAQERAVDGTLLTVDPPAPRAPATLARGGVADFEATSAFVISSQDVDHPFWIAQQMPGCNVIGGSRPGTDPSAQFGDCLGDEDNVGMIPPAQWLTRYVFFTDPTYATTNLALARAKDASGFHDVTVDCLGAVTGWQPIGGSLAYEFTSVDLVRAGVSVGSCQNGPHVATSDGPFGIVVWGLDSYASYSYPAGGNFKSINSVVVAATAR
jgi:hypothetical protein